MKTYKKEIKQIKRANVMLERFAKQLEKTEINAFPLYREIGKQIQINAERIEALKNEAYEMAENDAEYELLISQI